MAIQPGYKMNLETLISAAKNGDLALMECRDKQTDKPVITICAVQKDSEVFEFIPLAKMFDGNPYDELNPPT